MALVTATTADDPGTSGNPGFSSRVCTAVARAGAGDPDLIGPGDAGALFFHGDDDRTVPYAQARLTQQAMEAAGAPTRMVMTPGSGHAPPASMAITAAWLNEVMVTRTGTCAAPDPAHVSFVRAAYADLLGRAPTAAERGREVTRLDAGHRRADLLSRLTRSSEWVGAIVRELYLDTLGREPDRAGLQYWTTLIVSGRRTVAQVAASFYASDEYVGTGDRFGWIQDVYQEVLGRQVGPDEVDYWLGQAELRGRTWVTTRIYAALESRRARVTGLYQALLARDPDPAGLAFWADRVGREGDLALARSLTASAEYLAAARARFP